MIDLENLDNGYLPPKRLSAPLSRGALSNIKHKVKSSVGRAGGINIKRRDSSSTVRNIPIVVESSISRNNDGVASELIVPSDDGWANTEWLSPLGSNERVPNEHQIGTADVQPRVEG